MHPRSISTVQLLVRGTEKGKREEISAWSYATPHARADGEFTFVR